MQTTLPQLAAPATDDAIFLLGLDGVIQSWSAGHVASWRPEEVIGCHFSIFHPNGDAEACAEILARAERDGRYAEEGWRRRKDGSPYWASVVITPLRDAAGALRGFAKVTRDLHERRRLEQERVQLVEAKEAIQTRDEFLSIVSHELKTPLTALQLQLQILRERLQGTDPQLAARADRALRSGTRLTDLVESLLDVSRIATGRFELNLESGDLAETVRIVGDRLSEAALRAGCVVAVTAVPVPLSFDKLRMEQAITNLLSNAFKYGAGAPVQLNVRAEATDAVLEVRDHGPGIKTADMERIFARFERGVSSRHYGGLGLGLYVTRQIIEGHGGTVTAENCPPTGARFAVRLPLRRKEELH
jgi:PAS domain S-box-containing protein